MLTSLLLEKVPGIGHGFLSEWGGLDPKPWRPKQVHGADVMDLAGLDADPQEADGVIARRAGLPIGVVTADCIPLLLAHPARVEVAAVHVGWRGLAAGILEHTLQALGGPDGWRVALGPAAGGCCYEVGPDVLSALAPDPSDRVPTRPGHARLELRAIAIGRLLKAGVDRSQIEIVGPCTICSRQWPSYRRDGEKAGRILSWIERTK